jgi:arylsulfatase
LLGEVVALLKRRGLFEQTVLIVTGDHGDAFNEHPDSSIGHGFRLYEESIHVPLLFINPVLFHGERDDRIVRQLDIPATAAWLAGSGPQLNVGSAVFFERPANVAYMLNGDKDFVGAIVVDDRKLMVTLPQGGGKDIKLFDLHSDPAEQHDLAAGEPAKTRALEQRFFGWFKVWRDRWEWAERHEPGDRKAVEGELLNR